MNMLRKLFFIAFLVAGVSASVVLVTGTLSAGNAIGVSAYYNPAKPGWPNYTKYSSYTAT